ncbi:uncharacterized protein LOC141849841 [Brevipalpus obovatus]|uniref:uncharacterized protein LOC141849841 n=1 Tax=Brevipalpus obovatus TaxID=246614 RepID=UPI003D9F03F5
MVRNSKSRRIATRSRSLSKKKNTAIDGPENSKKFQEHHCDDSDGSILSASTLDYPVFFSLNCSLCFDPQRFRKLVLSRENLATFFLNGLISLSFGFEVLSAQIMPNPDHSWLIRFCTTLLCQIRPTQESAKGKSQEPVLINVFSFMGAKYFIRYLFEKSQENDLKRIPSPFKQIDVTFHGNIGDLQIERLCTKCVFVKRQKFFSCLCKPDHNSPTKSYLLDSQFIFINVWKIILSARQTPEKQFAPIEDLHDFFLLLACREFPPNTRNINPLFHRLVEELLPHRAEELLQRSTL